MVYKVSKSILDLDKTFNCGQCFSWFKYNGSWYGFIQGKSVKLTQHPDYVEIDGAISPEEFRYYFDLWTLYRFEDLTDYERRVVSAGAGIRILRQPIFDTIITFIISQQNNMVRIRKLVQKLCETYGSVGYKDGIALYSFPYREALLGCSEESLREMGMGYRAKYIAEFVHSARAGDHYWYLGLTENGYDYAIAELKKIYGVGDKVANCIALFGCGYKEAFPIDVHMKRILEREYKGNVSARHLEFNGLAGVMQQYMFYAEAFGK